MTVQAKIEARLEEAFNPTFLEVLNESFMHNVPAGSESHFKVTVASDSFSDVRKVKRHQMVYGVLADLLAGPVHALALHTYSNNEWSLTDSAPDSPDCHGGSKR